MSRSLNKVQLIGNLGADPEVRTTASGTLVANVSVATSRSFTSRDGTPVTSTQWHRVVLWDKLADIVAQYATRGTRLFVEGALEYRSYEDSAGVRRYVTEIRAQEIILLDAPRASNARSVDDVPPPEEPEDLIASREQESLPIEA